MEVSKRVLYNYSNSIRRNRTRDMSYIRLKLLYGTYLYAYGKRWIHTFARCSLSVHHRVWTL
jgi:hypothetical protein